MAAAEQQSADFQQKFQDITECPICMQTFTDPRILPCVHTFCAKCLETAALKSNYIPGKTMPCPMCRKEFQVPVDGMNKMTKNFFMLKLLEMSNVKESSESRDACDTCSEDNPGDVAPSVRLFCRQCCLKLCGSCCRHHRKSKLTKNHDLISVDESSAMTELPSVQDLCEVHKAEQLSIYCSQCETVVCAFCFIDNHQNHSWLNVNKAGDEFRQQLKTRIENLRKQCTEIEAKMSEAIRVKADVDQMMFVQESVIYARKNELLQLMEKYVESLKSELSLKLHEKLKEIAIEEKEFDLWIQILKSYTTYCHEMVTKGSPVDICRMQSELRSRAEELQQMSQSVCQRKTKPFEVDLRFGRFEELQKCLEQHERFSGETAKPNSQGSIFALRLGEKRVTGVAIIDQELFVTTEENSTVMIFDVETFKLMRSWFVIGLTRPEDMAASEGAKILYIFNAVGPDRGDILRLNVFGIVLSHLTLGNRRIRISTSYQPSATPCSERNVIVTSVDNFSWIIKEFQQSVVPVFIRETCFEMRLNFVVKLGNGRLLATYGDMREDWSHGIFEADENSCQFTRSYTCGLNCPEEIVVDQTTGFIFVNDRYNRRVLMLNSRLEYETDIISREAGLHDPRCMVLDSRKRRLLIADFDKINKCARILAVNVDQVTSFE